eukprot:TRINITY_DN19859_c0_g1_i1.p1 TRINITY_DN19859_c0_g1~~TRINITY_DN19859_c0_g1_i1.p1  ORF type:complete len:308 (+),score=42.79 TRINITY_DN19859_c0_g1_i1:47-925(+)
MIACGVPAFMVIFQLDEIRSLMDAMCGGDLDFVYINMESFPQLVQLDPANDGGPTVRTLEYALEFMTNYSRRTDSAPTWLDGDEADNAFRAGALSLYPKKCLDEENLQTVKLRLDTVDFLLYLEAYAGRSNVKTCNDVKDQCYGVTAFWVRYLCPKTCGCDKVPSPLWVRNGCPQTCEENDAYWQQERQIECKDVPKSDLVDDSIWRGWWVGNWTPWYARQWDGFKTDQVPGCEILEKNSPAGALPELLCAHGSSAQFSGNLRIFCPVTCGCQNGQEDCPLSCDSLRRSDAA